MKFKLIIGLLAFLLVPMAVFAAEYHNGTNVILPADSQIDSNYYAAGQNIEIYGTVNGDLFLAGDNITIDSENINGDVFAAANSINIKGNVNGSVRLAGQQINILGQVRDNLLVFGQKLDLDKDATINGHVNFFGQRANMRGTVNGHFDAFAESAFLSGTFNKDVQLNLSRGEEFEVADSTVVNGSLTYKAFKEGKIGEGATISNGVTFNEAVARQKSAWNKFSWKGILFKFFGMLVVGMVLLYLAGRFFKDAYNWVVRHPWSALLKGIILLVITPIVCVLLAVTIIGLPLAFVIMALWVVTLYLAQVMGAWLLGKLIKEKVFSKNTFSDIATLAAGIVVYIIISKIPFVGPIFTILVYLMAWGVFAKHIYNFKAKK